jgi:hypothetical protein
MAAHNWRTLRQRAMANGIGNLMALPTMHTVLDDIEQLGLESATAGAKTANDVRAKATSYFDRLYKPDVTTRIINGKAYLEPPPGFSEDEIEASFDAFLANVGR